MNPGLHTHSELVRELELYLTKPLHTTHTHLAQLTYKSAEHILKQRLNEIIKLNYHSQHTKNLNQSNYLCLF